MRVRRAKCSAAGLLPLLLVHSITVAACSGDGAGSGHATGADGAVGSTAASTGGAAFGAGASGATTTTTTTTTSATGGSGAGSFVELPCENKIFQCGDAIDNDGDGLVDWQDPDCLGPCDNTEDSLYPNLTGEPPSSPCISDCYWDANSGSGNDGCCWSHQCDPLEQGDPAYPEAASTCPYVPDIHVSCSGDSCASLFAQQPKTCTDVCGPLTPNGCDCFGCCELPAGTGKYVWVGTVDTSVSPPIGTCTLDATDDPTKCAPCTPVAACLNACDPCEVCIGKPLPDPGCTTQCIGGAQPCGLAGQALCPPDQYCITGCCEPLPN